MLERRRLLQGGAIAVAGLLSSRGAGAADPTRPEWMQVPGGPFTPYGTPAAHEAEVVRWVSANRAVPGNGASWTPLQALEGIVTPNGLHFERHHNGVPEIDPARHRLLIHGLVDRPLAFSVADLLRYPLQSRLCFIECAGNSNTSWNRRPLQSAAGNLHGLVSCAQWTGVPLSTVLAEAGVGARAAWLVAEGADAFAMKVSLPLEKALNDTLLALFQNGERLRPGNGYPLRLIVPGWEGVLSVKWLRRIELTDRPAMTRDETARYTDLLADGRARRFAFEQPVKSLITSPSAGMHLPPGLHQLSGLAWSGAGRIARVEVSTDGGASWADAALDEPILPACCTRFRLPWQWNGTPATLQSRATDEAGATQPERRALLRERGPNAYYRYNAIVRWHVNERGFVSHVYDEAEPEPGAGGAAGIDVDWQ
ncbi:MAG: sulfite dehydrogenase [Gammaproteobacteria bacterium]